MLVSLFEQCFHCKVSGGLSRDPVAGTWGDFGQVGNQHTSDWRGSRDPPQTPTHPGGGPPLREIQRQSREPRDAIFGRKFDVKVGSPRDAIFGIFVPNTKKLDLEPLLVVSL